MKYRKPIKIEREVMVRLGIPIQEKIKVIETKKEHEKELGKR